MSNVSEFVADYKKMSLFALAEKWMKRYDDIPVKEEVLAHLKQTNDLSAFGNSEAEALYKIEVTIGSVIASKPRGC